MVKADLHVAFFWICSNCAEENFERGVGIDPENLPEEYCAEELGINPEEEFHLVAAPKSVTCTECEIEFETSTGGNNEPNYEFLPPPEIN